MKKLPGWPTSLFLKNLASSSTGDSISFHPSLQPQMPQVAGVCKFQPCHFLHFVGPLIVSSLLAARRQVENPCNFIMQHNLALDFSQYHSFRLAQRQLFNRMTVRLRKKSSQRKGINSAARLKHSSSVFT